MSRPCGVATRDLSMRPGSRVGASGGAGRMGALRNLTRDGQLGFANNAYNAFMRNQRQPFAATLE